jgi:hypothetical protein
LQQLHLVGFTTDHDALIFSARKGAKSGGFLVALDDKFLDSIDEASRLRDGEGDGEGRRSSARRTTPRPESALSPRDIQMRLRAGRSIANVASEAGVDEEWISRFAAPILAEQAQVISRAQSLTFSKARLGASGRPLGESVWWNVSDKGVQMAQDTFDQCWSAHHLRDTAWIVRFEFVNRKKKQRAEWELDLREGSVVARNGSRLASELGYIEPGRRGRPPAPLPPPAKQIARPAAKAAGPAVAAQPKKRATKKAAKKRVPAGKVTGKRPAPKRAGPKRTATKRTATKRTATKRAAPKRTAAKKSAPKRAVAKKAAAKRPAVKAVKAVKRGTPRKATPRKATPKRPAPKRTAVKRPAAKRPAAKRATRPRSAPAAAPEPTIAPFLDAGEHTRPVTIRAPRASEPEPDDIGDDDIDEIDDEIEDDAADAVIDDAPAPPPPVLTSTPTPSAPRTEAPARRFGRLRRRRPPGS